MKRKLFQVILEFDDRKDYGSEDFEFIVDTRVEELGEPISDEGYYKCKKCGAK